MIDKRNFFYIQELKKQTYNKVVESQSYIPNKKVWFYKKSIKIK